MIVEETLIPVANIQTELEPAVAKAAAWKKESRWNRYYRERYELSSKYTKLILSHDGGYGDYDWIVDMHRNEYEFLKLCYSDLFQLN
ncbi:MAG TPA: hypothetical protein VG603_05550 [Chitinophagales bacterium]|nr:hypothetical protein [Chitinophagales bacterium]